jgi:ArsR family metal-binding transcriptional regulator
MSAVRIGTVAPSFGETISSGAADAANIMPAMAASIKLRIIVLLAFSTPKIVPYLASQ